MRTALTRPCPPAARLPACLPVYCSSFYGDGWQARAMSRNIVTSGQRKLVLLLVTDYLLGLVPVIPAKGHCYRRWCAKHAHSIATYVNVRLVCDLRGTSKVLCHVIDKSVPGAILYTILGVVRYTPEATVAFPRLQAYCHNKGLAIDTRCIVFQILGFSFAEAHDILLEEHERSQRAMHELWNSDLVPPDRLQCHLSRLQPTDSDSDSD